MATPKLSSLKQALFKLFETFDENNDKLIDFDEFKKAMIESGFVQPNAPKLQQKISQLFAMFDTDNSGTIKYTELTDQDSKFVDFLRQLNIKFIDDRIENTQTYEKVISQYKEEKESLEANLKLTIQKNAAMSEEIEQLKNEKNMLYTTVNELKTEINDLKKDKMELQSLSHKLKTNSNETYFQTEINNISETLRKTSENLENEKRENNKLSLHITTLNNKVTKLQNINKHLKYDNNQLLESTDELTSYCTELEVNLEMAENKIADMGHESLYDNIDTHVHTPIESRGSIKGRARTATIHMMNYDIQQDTYDHNMDQFDDTVGYDQIRQKSVSPRPINTGRHNRKRTMDFLRQRSLKVKDVNIIKKINENNNLYDDDDDNAAKRNNDDGMEDVKNMLMSLQNDVKKLNDNLDVYQKDRVSEVNVKAWWEWW
eukprot:540924_1